MPPLKNLLLLDYLARDRGHLLDDDRFLAGCLAPLADRFKVISSPESIARIRRDVSVETGELKARFRGFATNRMQYINQVLAADLSGFEDVLVQSPEEISLLFLMRKHPSKRFHLIFSYNLTPARFARHPKLGHAVLRRALRRASTVFVHCDFEADFIRLHYPEVPARRVWVKPYHQISAPRIRLDWQRKTPTILFLGPETPYKRIDPVIELMENDVDCRYRYVFASMASTDKPRYRSIEQRLNAEVRYGHTSDDDYYRLFRDALFVVLTHDEAFEGRLSGAFCDAVASGTAVIARDMAPHNEFFTRFGPLGFLVDFRENKWREVALHTDLSQRYTEWQQNIAACRQAHSPERVASTFQQAFAAC